VDCGTSTGPSSAAFNKGDRTDNGVIAIDKTSIVGSLDGGTLHLTIPVRSIADRGASGLLLVTLLDVQGLKTQAQAKASYSVPSGATSVLHVDVSAPPGVSGQADLALWNIRVEDDKPNSIRVTRSVLMVVPPYEVWLEGPSTVTQGRDVSYRVRAQNGVTRAPAGGVNVSLDFLAKDGSLANTASGQTNDTGEVFFPISLAQSGDFKAQAHTSQNGITPSVQDSVSVSALGPKVFLTSDKPIYQPGQTLNLRTLTLTAGDNKPVVSSPVLFEVMDGKGNKVFKQSVNTDAYGVAATTFTLGTLVNTGTFTLRATSNSVKTEKTVSVSTYALPKFDITVTTDKTWYRAGDTLVGTVDAHYFFGKNVAGGNVVVQGSSLDVGQTAFQKVMGTLDASGHFQFMMNVPKTLAGTPLAQGNASIDLHVTVTDTAGQSVDKETILTVSADGLNVALVPESTTLVPDLDNELDLFVTDPLGGPVAGAAVAINAPDGQTFQVTTDTYGQAAVTWHVPDAPAGASSPGGGIQLGGGGVQGGAPPPFFGNGGSTSFQVQVTPPGNAPPVSKSFSFMTQIGGEHLIVRTDASLYKFGDTVKVDIITGDTTHDVYVDWINAGQAVDMRTLQATAGHAAFTMNVDTTLNGSNRIEAYVVDSVGNVVRAGRTVFVTNDSSLAVAMTQDKPTYAPGDSAKLTFSVADNKGNPAVAALGVQIVDQSVFSLVDAHPGLLQAFFELDSMYATPTYQIAAPPVDYSQLLFSNDTDPAAAQAHQTLTKGAFAALGDASITGIAHGSYADVVNLDKMLLQPAYMAATSSLSAAVHALAYAIVGSRPSLTPMASDPTNQVVKQFSAWDFWGNPYKVESGGYYAVNLTSRGPDEIAGTADDQQVAVSFYDLAPGGALGFGGAANAGAQDGLPGGGFGGGGFAGGGSGAFGGGANAAPPPGVPEVAGSGSSSSSGGHNSGSGSAAGGGTSSAPRVRTDFPETLYVNPSVITGPDGRASVSVPLADSITEWRVSTLANSTDGKLGGGETGFKVFQDFFVDINFPATLTRGDQVSFPIAIYNYRTDVQTVQLSLVSDTWYTPAGATTLSVTMQPGEVTGASFPVTVNTVGLHSLTVQAIGTSKSDAVARAVQVLPDGKLFTDTSSGILTGGSSADHTFQFPSQAVAGSDQLYVEVYPAFLAQAVNGMESLLREPSGCFEQTTSTTWPNVLVLAYLTQTGKLTPEVQLKAQSLVSAGYQRLLTFEHPGGGFSWFGTQDPAPNLSVTAFGVMEFGDMAKVTTVDDAMVTRTRTWLLGQQQADGSWLGETTESFSFNSSTLRNTAFVLWALSSVGYSGPEVGKGVAYLRSHAGDMGNDAYTLALMANALELSAPNDPATAQVYSQLDTLKQVSGDQVHWDTGSSQTCFYQSGMDSSVSTTGLAAYALLLRGDSSSAEGAIKFLAAQKDANSNFGSTQATIWALRALLLAASKGTDGGVGTLTILVDGTTARTLALTADQSDVMTTVDLSGMASPGSHDVGVNFAGTGKVSFNAVGKYNLPWSLVPQPPSGPLSISVSYDKTSLYVNDTVTETVTLQNNTSSTEKMILATLGIPPGFNVSSADLDALVAANTLSKYELTGKQVLLYISQLAPSASLPIVYHLVATMPVQASDGAAEAHLYYEPSQSSQTAPQTFQVASR
jgi:hypothetical protein